MNVHVKLDSQEEFIQFMEAMKGLPFLDKLRVTVATPEDYVPSTVKKIVLDVLPSAELILFGSRARGESSKYSDWDFIVLTHQPASKEERKKIQNAVYELELGQSLEIQLIFKTRAVYETEEEASNLMRNVKTEGITV